MQMLQDLITIQKRHWRQKRVVKGGEKTCKGLDEACWRLNCSIGIISVAGNGVSRKRGANEEQKKNFV
jgi:hypothetical protein